MDIAVKESSQDGGRQLCLYTVWTRNLLSILKCLNIGNIVDRVAGGNVFSYRPKNLLIG